jgi:hypothetical protein
MQRGDRLLSPSSCEFSAVDGDLGGGVGKKLSRATCKLLEGKAERARNVRLAVRCFGQDVRDCERRIVQPTPELLAGDLGCGGGIGGIEFGRHDFSDATI